LSTRGLGHSRFSRGSVSGCLSQALMNWPARASARVAANASIEGTFQRPLCVAVVAFALSGCCAFAPCHPATAVFGLVRTQQTGAPIPAKVSLYGTSFNTNAVGCFKSRVADAFPFTFSVSAEGLKPVDSEAKRGFYRVSVVLAPLGSAEVSRIEWSAMSASEYDASSCA